MENFGHPLDHYVMVDLTLPDDGVVDDFAILDPNPDQSHNATNWQPEQKASHSLVDTVESSMMEVLTQEVQNNNGIVDAQMMLEKLLDTDQIKIMTSQNISLCVRDFANALERYFFGADTAEGHESFVTLLSQQVIAATLLEVNGLKSMAKVILRTGRRDLDGKIINQLTGVVENFVVVENKKGSSSPAPGILPQQLNSSKTTNKPRPICDECRKTFSSQAMVNRHKRNVHGKESGAGGKFICDACGARFKNKTSLTKHRKHICQ